MKIKDKYKGIFYIILAAFGFAFMNLFVKLAGDLPAIEKKLFPQSGGSFLFLRGNEEKKDFLFHSGGSRKIHIFPLFIRNHRCFCQFLCHR